MTTLAIPLANEAATSALGARLAPIIAVGDVILLSGELGAGKSTLARGLIKNLCSREEAPSPTFTFVETYETDRFTLWHFDFYRLESANDVWELGFEDALSDGVSLIEWPERIGSLAPTDAPIIKIEIKEGARIALITANQTWRKRLAAIGII